MAFSCSTDIWYTCVCRGCQFGPKVGQIGQNRGNNPGSLQIKFQSILAHRAKMDWNLIWRNPRFFRWKIWLTLGPHWYLRLLIPWVDYCSVIPTSPYTCLDLHCAMIYSLNHSLSKSHQKFITKTASHFISFFFLFILTDIRQLSNLTSTRSVVYKLKNSSIIVYKNNIILKKI